MMLPRWIPFAVAFWVIAFGIMRLRIATRKDDRDRPNYRKGGYYARSKRSHAIYGVAYLVLGAYCIATGFGYKMGFIASCMGPQATTEKTSEPPAGGIPATVVTPPSAEEGPTAAPAVPSEEGE